MKIKLTMIIAIGITTAIIACGETDTTNKKIIATTEVDISKNPDYIKGLELVAKSDCLTCHKINEKATGPAYSDVAAKYSPAADTTVQNLAHKIINGGVGVWGAIPMTPHPQVSQADAEQMVKYILLLKNS